MPAFEPAMTAYAERVRDSFARQPFMGLVGATIAISEPGRVSIGLPMRPDLTQQHGFVHGGLVASIADTAAGYAALSLIEADATVLTVEFKINFLAPTEGEDIVAIGEVLKPGRSLIVCRADVYATVDGRRRHTATASLTMARMAGKADAVGMGGG